MKNNFIHWIFGVIFGIGISILYSTIKINKNN